MNFKEILGSTAPNLSLKEFDIQRRQIVLEYARDVAAFLQFARMAGIPAQGSSERAWQVLNEMPIQDLEALRDRFRVYRQACEQANRVNDGILGRDLNLLWRFIQLMGYRPTSDLFDHITGEDVVEIYDRNHKQIFCNLRFFSVSSYSFEELKHLPAKELFERPPELMELLIQEVSALFASSDPKTVQSKLPPHIAKELHSKRKYTAQVQQGIISPLFNPSGSVEAVVCSIKVRILNVESEKIMPLSEAKSRLNPVGPNP